MTVKSISARTKPILLSYGVRKAALFGSHARGEASAKSDVDILIKTNGKMGLFRMVGLKLELEKALCKKIDLVEYGTLKPTLAKQVLKEQVAIL